MIVEGAAKHAPSLLVLLGLVLEARVEEVVEEGGSGGGGTALTPVASKVAQARCGQVGA